MSKHNYLWQEMYSILVDNRKGFNCEELMEKFKITKTAVYSQIHLINKKPNLDYKITNDNGIYLVIEKKHDLVPSTKLEKKPAGYSLNSIPKHLISLIKDLSETDKRDFNDMLKKSIFYGKSAIALLEANYHVKHLTKGV